MTNKPYIRIWEVKPKAEMQIIAPRSVKPIVQWPYYKRSGWDEDISGGAVAMWPGMEPNTSFKEKTEKGTRKTCRHPVYHGDLKEMSPEWLLSELVAMGVLAIGLGIPFLSEWRNCAVHGGFRWRPVYPVSITEMTIQTVFKKLRWGQLRRAEERDH